MYFDIVNNIHVENYKKIDHFVSCRIYQVHVELKDKLFKMGLSWVCEQSDGVHQLVPSEWYNKAYTAGVESKRDDDSDNEI